MMSAIFLGFFRNRSGFSHYRTSGPPRPRGLYSSNKLNCFPPEYIWNEYLSTISILLYTWNNDVFRDEKGFWCIKITNQIISLLKGYTNLVKEHSFSAFANTRTTFYEYPSTPDKNMWISFQPKSVLILKNIAPWLGARNNCVKKKVVNY